MSGRILGNREGHYKLLGPYINKVFDETSDKNETRTYLGVHMKLLNFYDSSNKSNNL